jgi:hypothetical protein
MLGGMIVLAALFTYLLGHMRQPPGPQVPAAS